MGAVVEIAQLLANRSLQFASACTFESERICGFARIAPFRLPPPSPAGGGRVPILNVRAFPFPCEAGNIGRIADVCSGCCPQGAPHGCGAYKVPQADGAVAEIAKLLANRSLQFASACTFESERICRFARIAPFRLPPPSPAGGGRVPKLKVRAFPFPCERGNIGRTADVCSGCCPQGAPHGCGAYKVPQAEGGARRDRRTTP